MIIDEKTENKALQIVDNFDLRKLLQCAKSLGVKGISSFITDEDETRLAEIHDRIVSFERPPTTEDILWLWKRLNKAFQDARVMEEKQMALTKLYLKASLGQVRLV